MPELMIDSALITNVGRARRQNEDYGGCFEPPKADHLAASGRLYVVADGIGGAAAREVASGDRGRHRRAGRDGCNRKRRIGPCMT
jgi:serine/threonine protein phosphatase PrpC